jgi:signal transduction histidine kinase
VHGRRLQRFRGETGRDAAAGVDDGPAPPEEGVNQSLPFPRHEAAPGEGPANILVVDDRAENRNALRAILSSPAYRIVEASSGEEALRRLLDEEFAVLLLDVVMPGMNGFELATAIKGRPKTATVPIVFLTAVASDADLIFKGYRVGAVDYLVKPLVPEMVRAKVAVFADLYRQRRCLEQQAVLLVEAARRESELRLLELGLASEKRFRALAEEAVRLRDDFLSIASHELRTPLQSLRLQIDTLIATPRGDGSKFVLAPEVREKLERTTKQIEQLTRLVGELMDASRIAAGKLRVDLERVDLAAVAGDVVGRSKEDAARAGCVVTLRADQPVLGNWDRLRMEQIVTNLLTNALKFGAGKPVEVSVSADGSRARVAVRDHGIGIPRDDIARIFERYERSSTAKRYGGLGLGLYIVSQIVAAHGGNVHVESTPGEGSLFTVELPLQPPPAAS